MTRDTFCSYCGAAYEKPLAYSSCKAQVWANPIPVATKSTRLGPKAARASSAKRPA